MDKSIDVEITQPFEWQEAGGSNIYRIIVGSSDGLADICDSGMIDVSQYFVPRLPIGQRIFGQLLLRDGGEWRVSDRFEFTVKSQNISTDGWIQGAHWAADRVRRMADRANRPESDTLLDGLIYPKEKANCSDYSLTLLMVLDQMNIALDSRVLNVFFNIGYEAHTLVELFDSSQQSWILVDPTFSLSVRRASDGHWATAEDMMISARSMRWSDITYVFLGAEEDGYARRYYMDYPLLFMNIWSDSVDFSKIPSILPYFTRVPVPSFGYRIYAIRMVEPGVAYLSREGKVYYIECMGVDNFSLMFNANSVEFVSGVEQFELYSPSWSVFR